VNEQRLNDVVKAWKEQLAKWEKEALNPESEVPRRCAIEHCLVLRQCISDLSSSQ
jgi:hypothetical protein